MSGHLDDGGRPGGEAPRSTDTASGRGTTAPRTPGASEPPPWQSPVWGTPPPWADEPAEPPVSVRPPEVDDPPPAAPAPVPGTRRRRATVIDLSGASTTRTPFG